METALDYVERGMKAIFRRFALRDVRRIFVPHPIQDATDDEMQAKADAIVDAVIEALVAVLFGASVVVYGASLHAVSAAAFGTLLLGIAITDARHYLIPDPLSLGGLVAGLAISPLPGPPSVLASILGAVAGFGVLFAVGLVGEWAFKKPAMGGGDMKMMAMVGAFLGPAGAMLTIFLGALVGTIVFAPVALRTDREVPFGVFLAVGAAATFLLGDALTDWYAGMFL